MDSRPLIAIFCNSFPPEGGAASNRMFRLARLLRDAGYRVEVVSSLPNYPQGRIFNGYRGSISVSGQVDGIQVQRCWIYASNSRRQLPRALSLITQRASFRILSFRRIRNLQPALVIVSSPPLPMAGAVVRYFGQAGIPVLLNVSDLWPLSAKVLGAAGESAVYRYLQRMERRMYEGATAISAQSREILEHISAMLPQSRPGFLLRNLPDASVVRTRPAPKSPGAILRVIYPGLLGHAQGVFPLIQSIDWHRIGASLELYGDGAEAESIRSWLAVRPELPVRLHAPIPEAALGELLPSFDAMLIPLVDEIPGAVPSKLFTAIHAGLPVLYSAGGEGAAIVQDAGIGLVSKPGDYAGLATRIVELRALPAAGWAALQEALWVAARREFDPGDQDRRLLAFIGDLLNPDNEAG